MADASIRVESLLLRRWVDADLDEFSAMHADVRVADWLGGVWDRSTCARVLSTYEEEFSRSGVSPWCVVDVGLGEVVGCVGLRCLDGSLPVEATHELIWHLRPEHWGSGHATVAARAALDAAATLVSQREVVAVTAVTNSRSRAVMARLGMGHSRDEDFDHPRLESTHPLHRHVVYRFDQ